MSLKLKKFEQYNQQEVREFIDTIEEEFRDKDLTLEDMTERIKSLIDKNIINSPLEVILYDIVGTLNPPSLYYYIAKMICKGNPKKLKILNELWDPATIKYNSTTYLQDWANE